MLHTPEILAGNGMDLTLLEKQGARLKWQQQQRQQQELHLPGQSHFNDTHFGLLPLPSTTQQLQDFINNDSSKRDLVGRSLMVDPGLENGWPDFSKYAASLVSSSVTDYSMSRTSSCPPTVDNAVAPAPVTGKKGSEISPADKLGSNVGRESFSVKKRKADKTQNPKVSVAEDTRDKKIKLDAEEDSKATDQNNSNRETSADSAKENSKVTEVQKPDYIHVRARRGQATDSHSLAERVRREKISERMKYLQDLVPGCNKITGKAGMLDEIINYVQSLQRQVEFLSMKLAAVNPRLDFSIDNFFAKEIFPSCADNFPTAAMSSEVPNCSAYLPLINPVQQQVVSCCGFDMVTNPQEMALRRTISSPVSLPETLLDTSCFTQVQPPSSSSPWETDLQSLYNVDFNQGRSIGFPPQSFTGSLEANSLKMEM